MKRRDVLAGLAMLTGCALAPHAGFAQAKYPDRAIKLVVPFAPGGVNDAVARLWVERMKAVKKEFERIGGPVKLTWVTAQGTLGLPRIYLKP